MSPNSRAVVTAVASALVAGAAFVGIGALLAVSALLVGLLAWGWPVLLESPTRWCSTVVIAASGVGGVMVAWRTMGEPVLRYLPFVIAGALVMAFLAEMMRRDGRDRLVESVSGTVAGAFMAAAGGAWIATARSIGGPGLVVIAAIAMTVAAVVAALPVARDSIGSAVSVVLAGGAGAGASAFVVGVSAVSGLIVGVVAGLTVLVVRLLLAKLPPVRNRGAGIAAAVIPVAAGAMAVFAVGRLTLG